MTTESDSTWLEETLSMLNNRPQWLTLTSISNKTGLPLGWLKMLSSGKIVEPSVVRIETLYNFLRSPAANK